MTLTLRFRLDADLLLEVLKHPPRARIRAVWSLGRALAVAGAEGRAFLGMLREHRLWKAP